MDSEVEASTRISVAGRFAKRWRHASTLDQGYLAGLAFVAVFVLLVLAKLDTSAEIVGCVGAIFLGISLAVEIYLLVVKYWEQPWGKVIGVAISAMVVPMALGMSSNAVNLATGSPPEDFPYTVGLLAPMASLYAFAFLAVAITVLGSPIFFAVVAIRTALAKKSEVDGLTRSLMVRVLAIIAAWVLVAAAWEKGEPSYASALTSVARYAAYVLDSYPNDSCARNDKERINRISDEVVIVATSLDTKIAFHRRTCDIAE